MSDIDLSKLPDEAKQELIDYYEFLLTNYSKKQLIMNESNLKFEDFYLKPIKVDHFIKHTRESLHER